MRGRLFWKIFVAFFLAFIAQVAAMWVLLQFVLPQTPKVELSDYRALQMQLFDLAHAAVRERGVDAVDSDLFVGGSAPFLLQEIDASRVETPPPGNVVVSTDAGATQLLSLRDPAPGKRIPAPAAQAYVNAVGLALGLLFAAGLALYLSRPIRALKAGLDAFAAGDFRVRLGERTGGRRDEIADLARDFDGMADRVEALIQTRDQLINDVSHELRSPLTRLRLAIALARQRPERTAAALERVESEASRLDEIVDSLLTLSRLESGVAEHQEYFDLAELLRKLIADARFESGTVQLGFETVSSDDAPSYSIRGDAELIRRAVENVMRNAIRFSPAQGTILISVVQRAAEATIKIEDEGPGVAESELRKLFEPFIKGPGGGFGLGLAIAQRAVLAHGGVIFAENRASGGLRVTISLPTAAHAK